MKRVLITGKNSYIGTNVERWLMKEPDKYLVETIGLRDPNWKVFDFSKFDVVLHVAGIAHIKETNKNKKLYYQVNRDLAYETALKAKIENVKQFIFISSMSVYGIDKGIINEKTELKPKTSYGISKYEAEALIMKLESQDFKISILRPPLIYGRKCKGNYAKISKIALKTLFFPNIKNYRSMLYIDNLSELVKIIISFEKKGFFHPQNIEYVQTFDLINSIAKYHGKKIYPISILNFFLKKVNSKLTNKVFGDLVYEKYLSSFNLNYTIVDFKNSIRFSESDYV
jgi:UDP-glucose 4-epimerase